MGGDEDRVKMKWMVDMEKEGVGVEDEKENFT